MQGKRQLEVRHMASFPIPDKVTEPEIKCYPEETVPDLKTVSTEIFSKHGDVPLGNVTAEDGKESATPPSLNPWASPAEESEKDKERLEVEAEVDKEINCIRSESKEVMAKLGEEAGFRIDPKIADTNVMLTGQVVILSQKLCSLNSEKTKRKTETWNSTRDVKTSRQSWTRRWRLTRDVPNSLLLTNWSRCIPPLSQSNVRPKRRRIVWPQLGRG